MWKILKIYYLSHTYINNAQNRIQKRINDRELDITNWHLILKISKIAKYANYGYCRHENEIGKYLSNRDIKADVVAKEGSIIAYFRGEKYTPYQLAQRTMIERYSSLYFRMAQVPNAKVDFLWNGDIQEVLPALFTKIESILYPIRHSPYYDRIIFTGHGVGGGTCEIPTLFYAVLAALSFQLKLNGGEFQDWLNPNFIVETYTFGQPRIGTPEFAQLIESTILVYRITHTNDYISRLFLPTPYFRHHGVEIWIANQNCDCEHERGQGVTYMGTHDLNLPIYMCLADSSTGEENHNCNVGTSDYSTDFEGSPLGPYFGDIPIIINNLIASPDNSFRYIKEIRETFVNNVEFRHPFLFVKGNPGSRDAYDFITGFSPEKTDVTLTSKAVIDLSANTQLRIFPKRIIAARHIVILTLRKNPHDQKYYISSQEDLFQFENYFSMVSGVIMFLKVFLGYIVVWLGWILSNFGWV
ncbi:hypothetical protein G9A89_002300 [Geosiphon pyriformis]|nr:hypothetical protein G9A89_002300 [Geosiphon pyriformis]